MSTAHQQKTQSESGESLRQQEQQNCSVEARKKRKTEKPPIRPNKENDGGESLLSGQPRETGGDRPK